MTIDKGNRKHGTHSRKARSQAFKIILIKAMVCIALSLVLLLHSPVTAWSALLGGGIYLLPHLYFTHRALTFSQNQSARAALTEMYVSQIWKMGLSAAAFAATFILVQPLNPFSLFGTFILLQGVGWFAQMKMNKRFLKL